MNPNEPYRNVQNTSEGFGSVPQSSEVFTDIQSTSKRTGGVGRGKMYADAKIPDHDVGPDFIIMEEAYLLFESKGERRSLRMIGEYCKTGELICDYDSDDKRWHITRESVEQKIAKIKALNARRQQATAVPPSTSESFSERPAAPQRPAEESRSDRETTPPRTAEAVPPQNESDPSPFALVKKLKKRILDLRILNKGKDYVIEQMHKEREQLLTRLETSSQRIGELEIENRTLRLEGPRKQTTAETPLQHAVTYREVEDVLSSHNADPDPSVSPNESLADNVNTYEHSPQA